MHIQARFAPVSHEPIMAPPSACHPTLYGQADLKPCNPEQNLRLPNMGSMSNTSWHLQPMAAW